MTCIGIEDLLYTEFYAKNIIASNAFFPVDVENDYLDNGRPKFLIHMMIDGTRIYKTENDSVTISSGSLAFLPHGAKYYTRSINVGLPQCKGLSVLFELVDKDGDPLQIRSETLHVRHDTNGRYIKLCRAMLRCTLEEPDNILEIKSLLLRLLSEIAKDVKGTPPAALIPAFDMMTTRYRENLSVKEYADRCHMSESHFRKKFTEYTGKSPIQYRNELRFAEARRLYLEGATMSEIAGEIGFFDAGYFSKMYKKSNGHLLSSESKKDMI